MARVSKKFSRSVASVAHFVSAIRAAGFSTAGAAYVETLPPSLIVHYESANGDPTAFVRAYTDPDRLDILYNKPVAHDGIPDAAANGSDVHVVTLRQVDPMSGATRVGATKALRVVGHFPIQVAPLPVQMVNGIATVSFGPVTMIGEWDFMVSDPQNKFDQATIHLRFA